MNPRKAKAKAFEPATVTRLINGLNRMAEHERALVFSRVWWHFYSRDGVEPPKRIARLKAETPYPTEPIGVERMGVLVKMLPVCFRHSKVGAKFRGFQEDPNRREGFHTNGDTKALGKYVETYYIDRNAPEFLKDPWFLR